uniref:Uncharacterized protein n=1 Tax=uncultured marine group II/III euryarchaeote KM3_61_H04 TaxID=1456471 RepID=A0A075HFZ2_9EURY|nr:hypothetical protein [uncultured marine group II/III euryarchaeote KM3_61_H04]
MKSVTVTSEGMPRAGSPATAMVVTSKSGRGSRTVTLKLWRLSSSFHSSIAFNGSTSMMIVWLPTIEVPLFKSQTTHASARPGNWLKPISVALLTAGMMKSVISIALPFSGWSQKRTRTSKAVSTTSTLSTITETLMAWFWNTSSSHSSSGSATRP